jgi:hypothetical protein
MLTRLRPTVLIAVLVGSFCSMAASAATLTLSGTIRDFAY